MYMLTVDVSQPTLLTVQYVMWFQFWDDVMCLHIMAHT